MGYRWANSTISFYDKAAVVRFVRDALATVPEHHMWTMTIEPKRSGEYYVDIATTELWEDIVIPNSSEEQQPT